MERKATVRIHYKNYRGEISWRDIIPIERKVMDTEWHGKGRLIQIAYDVAKGENREFCVDDILEWIDLPTEQ